MDSSPCWVWEITHPAFGHIQVIEAGFETLREYNPDFPEPREDICLFSAVRFNNIDQRVAAGGKRSILVLVDGAPTARFERPINARFAFDAKCEPGKFSPERPIVARNYGIIQANPFREIMEIKLRTSQGVVILEPPSGTPAARRHQAMEGSPMKRLLYPLLGGMGKVVWAFALLIVGPLLSKLLGFLPSISLPNIPWPDIPWPSIPWPNFSLPRFHVPELPPWVIWMLDHTKFWMPIVAGLVIGLIAYWDHKRSRKTRQRWMQEIR